MYGEPGDAVEAMAADEWVFNDPHGGLVGGTRALFVCSRDPALIGGRPASVFTHEPISRGGLSRVVRLSAHCG